MRRPPFITTVVFDLDDTLYDCRRQRVLAAHRHACRRLLTAGLRDRKGRRPTLTRLLRLRLALFRQTQNLLQLDLLLCRRLGVRGAAARRLARAGHNAYFGYPVGKLRLFPETRATLARLHKLGVRIYVLTAGRLSTQRAKVRMLGLDRLPHIDRIFFTGLMRGRGKDEYLRRVLAREKNPQRTLVVGDRLDSEIRAARALGMWAVQRRGGEFASYKPRRRLERPHFSISRLSQLFRLPFVFGKPGPSLRLR